MATRTEYSCDKCGEPIVDDEPVTLYSLRYVIRGAEPRNRVELCARCFAELRRWLRPDAG